MDPGGLAYLLGERDDSQRRLSKRFVLSLRATAVSIYASPVCRGVGRIPLAPSPENPCAPSCSVAGNLGKGPPPMLSAWCLGLCSVKEITATKDVLWRRGSSLSEAIATIVEDDLCNGSSIAVVAK